MAKPGPQQRFNNIIDRISFKGGGIVFCFVSYSALNFGAPPTDGEPVTLSVTPWGADPMNVFSGNITFPGDTGVQVVNPVSALMRQKLDQWYVGTNDPYRHKDEITGSPSVGRWATYSASSDAVNARAFGKPITGPPNAANIDSPTWYLNNNGTPMTYGEVWGSFTSLSEAQLNANQRNAANAPFAGNPGSPQADWQVIEIKKPVTDKSFSTRGQVSFALNSGRVPKDKLGKDPVTGDPTYTFQVDMPNMPTGAEGRGWVISAIAFDGTVSDFPVDAVNSPVFSPFKIDDPNAPIFTFPNGDTIRINKKTGKPASGVGVAASGDDAESVVFTVNIKSLKMTVSSSPTPQ